MFDRPSLRAVGLGALLLLAACGKTAADKDAPLAFVDADTAFVYANSEPLPAATLKKWDGNIQQVWPLMIAMYDKSLSDLESAQASNPDVITPVPVRILRASLEEFRHRDSFAKWAEIGLDPSGHGAVYGVGMVPVLRVELSDTTAFRAMIARIEAASGSSMTASKVGEQEVWLIPGDKVQGLIAIQGNHLVASLLPANADDALTKRVLGVTRPASSLLADGGFARFNKREGYVAYGSGWIDFSRVVSLIDNDAGYRAFAQLMGDVPALDGECRADLETITRRVPRWVFGYTALSPQRMDASSRLELDATLAAAVQTLAAPPAGSAAAAGDALYDMSLSLPVLKYKQFLLDRANAIVAEPFRCAALASWNESAAELKQQLGQTIPPPFSDLTGLRLSMDSFAWPNDGEPSFSGQLLVASSNPMGILTMAKLALPALRELDLQADGKPVLLPSGLIPDTLDVQPEVTVAMNATALAFATGAGTDVSAYLKAPAAKDALLMRITYSGQLYGLIADMSERFGNLLPEEERATLESQRALYALYKDWLAFTDIRIVATGQGIEIEQQMEFTR